MPTLPERFSQAYNALRGRETRNVLLPLESAFQYYGLPPLFNPAESLKAYGDNPWLGGAVDRIAREIARTEFHLQTEDEDGEIEIIRGHEALNTLQKPQPTKTGKSLLTGMQLKLVTGCHLCMTGEAFWILDKRRKINGAPTQIDLLIPQQVYEVIENGELTEYVYRLPQREIQIRPEDVVHFKLPDPEKWQRGQGCDSPCRPRGLYPLRRRQPFKGDFVSKFRIKL